MVSAALNVVLGNADGETSAEPLWQSGGETYPHKQFLWHLQTAGSVRPVFFLSPRISKFSARSAKYRGSTRDYVKRADRKGARILQPSARSLLLPEMAYNPHRYAQPSSHPKMIVLVGCYIVRIRRTLS